MSTARGHIAWDTEVFILQGKTRDALLQELSRVGSVLEPPHDFRFADLASTLNRRLEPGWMRLAIVAGNFSDLQKKIAFAQGKLSDPSCTRVKERDGIFFFEQPLAHDGKLAFLFPGEGAQYVNMLADLCIAFPRVREAFDRIDRVFAGHERNYLPGQIIFPPPDALLEERAAEMLWKMDCATEAVSAANQALYALLTDLGIRSDAMVGHSTGEYSSLAAAGALAFENEERFTEAILKLNGVYEKLSKDDRIPEGRLLVVGALARRDLLEVMEEVDGDLYLAMDNCPHQVLLFGDKDVIGRTSDLLRSRGGILNELPFNRAYHTPLFEPFVAALRGVYRDLSFRTPETTLYSCATASVFPENPEDVRELAITQWARPVRFRETIEAMYDAGVRLFLEVGPRSNLTNFVKDILRKKPFLAVASNSERRSGLTQLNFAIAQLAAHGVNMHLDALYAGRARPLEDIQAPETAKSTYSMDLSIVLPALQLDERDLPEDDADVSLFSAGKESQAFSGDGFHAATTGGSTTESPAAMQAYFRTMEDFLQTQEQVMRAYFGGEMPERANRDADPSVLPLASPFESPAISLEPEPIANASGTETTPLAVDERNTAEMLLDIVSDRTGYPVDMLDLELDLEADLGIDSIKRVEILGALQKKTGLFAAEEMERISRLKTLRQIIEFIDEEPNGDASRSRPEQDASPDGNFVEISLQKDALKGYPLLGEVVRYAPGESLICVRRLSVEHDLFLRDHAIGGRVSDVDEALAALPVMPLTMTMEMMAQAAKYLAPDLALVGMRNVSAYSWIAMEEAVLPLVIQAGARKGDGGTLLVQVGIFEGKTPEASNKVFEGTVVMAPKYDDAPPFEDTDQSDKSPSTWTKEQLYTSGMFNGPRFHGVESMDFVSDAGAEATLRALPAASFFASGVAEFISDPIVLDAAGQVVGFWAFETLETGSVMFPIRFKSLHYYGGPFSVGEEVVCKVQLTSLDDERVVSDISLLDARGRIRVSIVGWTDRRYYLSRPASLFVLSPGEHMLSERVDDSSATVRCRLDTAGPVCSDFDATIWQNVVSRVLLSRAERAEFALLRGQGIVSKDWLLERLVAKDAVRCWMKELHNRECLPADIEVDLGNKIATMHGDRPKTVRIDLSLRGSIIEAAAVEPESTG